MRYLAPAVVAVALAFPAAASAHARLVRTEPADGAVLSKAPAAVRVVFDDEVTVGGAIAAVRNGDGSVLAGKPRLAAGGRELVIPLRGGLARGDYSVRWQAISDDGHELAEVLAFSVGTGREPAASVLSAGSGRSARELIGRWLLFAGVLVAGGAAFFYLAVWRPAVGRAADAAEGLDALERREKTLFAVVHGALLLAFLGAIMLAEGASRTRFSVVVQVAAGISIAGALAAAAAREVPRLRPVAAVLAIVLIALPTLAGHALDGGQPWVSPVADILHLAAAAFWTGGLVAVGLVLTARGHNLSSTIAKRFSALAVGAVVALAATGVVRAWTELSALDQLWTTAYGRALLVKTALLSGLVAIGWANRYRLVPQLEPARLNPTGTRIRAALRRNVVAELALLAVLVGAVAVLTDSVPGKQAVAATERPSDSRPAAPAGPPPLPPADALVLAGQARELAVTLAARPRASGGVSATVTVLGQDAAGVPGLAVVLDAGRAAADAEPCGAGCYRATLDAVPRVLTVHLSGRGRVASAVPFRFPESWPAPRADALVRRAARVYERLRTLRYAERLESRPGRETVSRFRVQAPDRLAYEIEGGADGIVIGARRWDRLPGRRWVPSPQTPLDLPSPPWQRFRNARLLGSDRLGGRRVRLVSFLDPSIPAWFRIAVDEPTGRTLDLRMVAVAHFMHDVYSRFDEPLEIRPPRASVS